MDTGYNDVLERLDILKVSEYSPDKKSLYLQALSSREKDFYVNILNTKKIDWLLGRWVAKQCLTEYFWRQSGMSFPLDCFEVWSGEGGRPQVCVSKEVSQSNNYELPLVSISHTNGECAAARVVSPTLCAGVGVDVEVVRPWNEFVTRRYLTMDEYAYIKATTDNKQELLATVLWSLKESYLKALGVGLRQHPRTVNMLEFVSVSDFEKSVGGVVGGWVMHQQKYIISSVFLKKT